MAITVGDIYKQFPTFKKEDMIKLMDGRDDFTGRDTVSLANIASYKGEYAKELSIFTAQKEGKSFVNMCQESKRTEISQGINGNSKDDKNVADNGVVPQNVPMDMSIFDVAKQREI